MVGQSRSQFEIAKLLDGVAGGEVERLAAGESFVLTMIKTNAVLAELPAKINLFIADDRRKVEQADFEILDDAAGFQDAVERGLQRFRELRMLHADGGQLIVRHNHAAHHHDARGYGG